MKHYKATITYQEQDGSVKTIVAKIRYEAGQVFYIKPGGRKERFLCLQQYVINEWSEAML